MSRPAPSAADLALTVALAQGGDRRALDRLLRDHQSALLRHARTVTGEEEGALDAVQASMLLIARRLSTLRDPRWFRAWAYRITTREAVRVAKRCGRDRRLFADDVEVESLDVPAAAEDVPELLSTCTASIDRLPDGARLVLALHYLEGLTLVEIAEALEVPVGTIKSRLAYGLVRLRELVAAT